MTGPAQERVLRRRRGVGPVSQTLLVVVLVAAVGFGYWGRNQTFRAVANGDGFVSAVAAPERVLSDVGGTIAPHDIRVGTRVRKGQLLFGVEIVTEVAERSKSVSVPKALRAAIARLAAEAEGRRQVTFPADLAGGVEAEGERARFEERLVQLERRKQTLRDSARQARLDIAERKAAAEQASRARDLAQQELEMLGPLVDRGISPKLEFLRVQQKVQELDAQRERALLAVPRLEASIREAERKVEEAAADFRNRAKQLLSEKRSERAAKARAVIKTERRVASTGIRAPIDGGILYVSAPRSAVRAGQQVAIIAPPVKVRDIVGRFPANTGVALRLNQKVNVTRDEGRDFRVIEAELAEIEPAPRNSTGDDAGWAVKLRVSSGTPGFESLGNARRRVRLTVTSEQPVLDYLWNRITVASGGRIVERLTMK